MVLMVLMVDLLMALMALMVDSGKAAILPTSSVSKSSSSFPAIRAF